MAERFKRESKSHVRGNGALTWYAPVWGSDRFDACDFTAIGIKPDNYEQRQDAMRRATIERRKKSKQAAKQRKVDDRETRDAILRFNTRPLTISPAARKRQAQMKKGR